MKLPGITIVLPIKMLTYLLILFFLCGAFSAAAKKRTYLIDSIPFNQWVREIEKAGKYRFYHDTSLIGRQNVPDDAATADVKVVLKNVFDQSSFHFVVDSHLNVFITRKIYPLPFSIASSFFDSDSFEKTMPDSVFEKLPKKTVEIANAEENRIIEIGSPSNVRDGNRSVAGYVRDEKNGESISGATIAVDGNPVAVTDQFGYYSLVIKPGRHDITVSSMSMKPARRMIVVNGDGKLNIELKNEVPSLKNVIVVAERGSNVKNLQMGVEKLSIGTIKSVPVLLGEADVLRVILTLPGVTSVGDASTGFNVRGGSADQNLILLNDATVYNPAHLFGFFSAFNPDVIKGIELYKGSIPEKYGGRLSSVLEVTTKDGNSKKWTGTGGIGFLTGKLTAEGPIVKDKTSMIIGARTTYSDWLLRQIRNSGYSNSTASFYDVDMHVTHIIDPRNSIYFTAYTSNDRFNLSNDTLYKYGNNNLVLKWKHNFNNNLYASFIAGLDDYWYKVSGNQHTLRGFEMKFGIRQYHVKADFNYSPNSKHVFSYGLESILYKLQPGTLQPVGGQTLIVIEKIQPEQALESAVYVGDKITVTPKLSVNAGVRYSLFNYLGSKDVNVYAQDLPKETSTIRGTIHYDSWKNIKTYQGPELRLSLRYSLSGNASVKASYNSLRQYIHLLYNTTAISPTDIWKLSDPNIKPQFGEQYSIGFYKNFKANTIETSIEAYYKTLKNFLDYKSGADLVLNQHIETEVISTKGYSYGAEFLIKKSTGKWNGWVSYTYSRTLLKQDDPLAGQLINYGRYYPANFDRPHNANFISNYRFSHRYSVSLNTVYSTGRPITLPIAVFNIAGSQRVFYSDRNQYRIPDYFRMDFSVNVEGNHKVKKATHNSWSAGVYNVTARKNPYSVYFTEENGIIKGYKLSVIGTAIPFITYNFRF